jgi:signal transduction histidine kinase
VLGHLELVRRASGLPGPIRRDLALIHREADRAARIVRNLLLFAGSGRLQRRALDINAVASRVLKLRAKALEAGGIEVTRDLAAGLPRIKGDGLLLQQALLNLVINAEQAMAGGGRLAVRTAAVAPGRIELSVEDTGPGLTPEVRSRLFEPFFTTKDVGHGTGLGLAITFGIVQAHGGTIEAGNHDGGGARFAITFAQ